MHRLLLPIALVLLAGGTFLVAQNVTVIETRGQPVSVPALHILGGSGGGGLSSAKMLRVTFSTPDSSRLQVGQPFDYDVLITNASKKDILVPQSLYSSDVIDTADSEHRYTELALSFGLTTREGSRTFVDGHVALYGRASKAETMLTLRPGDSIRILGTANLTPNWDKQPESPLLTAGMQAYVSINAAKVSPAKNAAVPDGYHSDDRQLYWAKSDNCVETEISIAK